MRVCRLCKSLFLCSAVVFVVSCKQVENDVEWSVWDQIKKRAQPYNALPNEFVDLHKQPLATLGWEDGVGISNDGLYLYCTYVPGDFLSWTIDSRDVTTFEKYRRGPLWGMDLLTNPAGLATWVQSDLLISQRPSVDDEFVGWNLSGMARAVFSEGAPTPFDGKLIVYTSNDKAPTYDIDIWVADGYPNPTGPGRPLPGFSHTSFVEDNPHLAHIGADSLLLLFDSDNYPDGKGDHDIWYAISTDDGATWGATQNLTSVNTPLKEHQPFLHHDKSGRWYLYFSAYGTDGKLAIYRSVQNALNNWNDWGNRELVIGAGNTAGVGEASLTNKGDLSFVLVYENPDGSEFNRYDADPWYAKRR